MNIQPKGVLPDTVIRDPISTAEFQFVTFRTGPDISTLEKFLRDLTEAVDELNSGSGDEQIASACVGFGRRFFQRCPIQPSGLGEERVVSSGVLLDVDLVVYVMSREEWRVAQFRSRLAAIGASLIESVTVHRGYQRRDGRELGGFRDGLRNAKEDRESVVFIDRNRDPNEPPAAENGTYMVAMRVVQNLSAWEALSLAEQEQVIGRRKADGSRLDLPEGTAVDQEGEIGAGCPFSSHVAKSGPRAQRDRVKIFRRGVPFTEFLPDGQIVAGLQFVSFQASLDQFTTISEEWIGNPDFPFTGTGRDPLFDRGFASITHTGFFFVPPQAEFLCAGFLHPKIEEDRCLGHLAVRKRLIDGSGNPLRAERGGFGFQLFDALTGTPIGDAFTTDSTGRALSPAVPTGVNYIVREVAPRPGFNPAPEQSVVLVGRRLQIEFVNQAIVPNPGYGN
jgi:Dyp-type peroxidase family